MKVKQTKTGYMLRLVTGEEIVRALEVFAGEYKIGMAAFTMLGAVSQVELGYYTLGERQYHWKEFNGEFEVLSGIGNISMLNGAAMIHLHTTLSGPDFAAFGGHMRRGIVAASLEVMVVCEENIILRKLDEASGLNLWEI